MARSRVDDATVNFRKLNVSKSDISNCDFYPLRMTRDRRTEMYVKFSKIMLIFQGPNTDEKRAAIEQLTSTFKYTSRLISDETFKREGARQHFQDNTADFYTYFRSRAKKSCEDGYNIIIIDQSMTNTSQMQYYFFLAHTMQYLILPYPPLVSELFERNFKSKETQATELAVTKKGNLFKHLFCGWFLHDIDSVELRDEANLYVQDCFTLPEFKQLFSKVCEPGEFASLYNMVKKRQNLAFCTVKIFQGILDVKSYMSSDAFLKFYGSMSKLFIVGFIISPHMIAARIKLTYEQRKLWEMPDELNENQEVTVFPSKLLESTKVNLPQEKITLISSKNNRTIISGEPISQPTESIHPHARGRSCHIVIGKVKEAPLRNVDYDVAFAVFRERNVLQKNAADFKPYDLDRCLVRRIGKYWFIYLKETLIVNGLFATCCDIEK